MCRAGQFVKHRKKAGGHIGWNIVEISIKMKTIVWKLLMIKIYYLYSSEYCLDFSMRPWAFFKRLMPQSGTNTVNCSNLVLNDRVKWFSNCKCFLSFICHQDRIPKPTDDFTLMFFLSSAYSCCALCPAR